MSLNSVLASRGVQLARDAAGSAAGRFGQALHAVSPAAHRRFAQALTHGPCAKSHGGIIARQVDGLERGIAPLDVVTAVSLHLKHGLAAGAFDRWIDRPKSSEESTKRTLARCDNYLPGHRWKLQLFYIPEGQSHPPHSHDDVASCLIVARGTIAAREFNRLRRLENGGDTIMLEQASDRVLGPGDTLLTNDEYHNVHWFGAVGGPAVAFNFQVVGFSQGKKPSEKLRSYIDLSKGPWNGPFPAPRLGKDEAHARFANLPLSAF